MCCDGLFFFIPIVIDSLVVISYLTFNSPSINIDDEGRKKRKEKKEEEWDFFIHNTTVLYI